MAEDIGIAGLLYAGAAVIGPIKWGVAIGNHIIIALGTYIYDKSQEKEALIENMKDFKKKLSLSNLMVIKIKLKLLYMKNDTEKEIEKCVDSQNSEFRGIK